MGASTWGEGSLPNFNFFNVNPLIFQQNRKVHLSNCHKNVSTTFLTLVSVFLDVGIIVNATLYEENFSPKC